MTTRRRPAGVRVGVPVVADDAVEDFGEVLDENVRLVVDAPSAR
ncbi:hypothetical protein [Streptomyces sp. NPDC052107]